jgi:glycosyltransferase involved in cell wall biosynthesis
VFQNALRMEEWSADAKRDWSLRTPAEIRYVGSILGEAQRDAIHDACEAVVQLRAAGREVGLCVYSAPTQTRELASWGYPAEVLKIESPPNPGDVPKLMAMADILLLPFNFDESSARYLRFSMPTKIPAYMISGGPILVYGPEQLAAVRYAADADFAHVVTTHGAASLASGIARLLDDEVLRRTLGLRAQRLAAESHDIGRVRERFWSALAAGARNGEDPYRERAS